MRFALDLPNFGPYADPALVVDLAREAEQAGWDGFSLWDHILYFSGNSVADPWVLLTAVAMATERLQLQMMVTPLPRRRPWVVSRQAVTLDHLSGGRFVLGVGIGNPPGPEFAAFGEPADARTRAEMLDESLAILSGMWSGEPFGFTGDHYSIEENEFQPVPLQQPRIPIWIAGTWPNKGPMKRAARWDGCAPLAAEDGGTRFATPAEVVEIHEYLDALRPRPDHYDMAVGVASPDSPDELVELSGRYAAAGTTWLRVMPPHDDEPDLVREWVAAGPPIF